FLTDGVEAAGDAIGVEIEGDFRGTRITETAAAQRDVRAARLLLNFPVRYAFDVERRPPVHRRERRDLLDEQRGEAIDMRGDAVHPDLVEQRETRGQRGDRQEVWRAILERQLPRPET